MDFRRSPGCFLPSHGNWSNATSTSGFKQQQGVRFAQLYVDRSQTMSTASAKGTNSRSLSSSSCKWAGDCNYARFGYAQTVRLVPSKDSGTLRLQVFVDQSIVEAFAQNGRAAVTARVYPRLGGERIGVTPSCTTCTWTWTSGR